MHKPAETAAVYSIQVQGELDASWSSWFENMSIGVTQTAAATLTTISGPVADQAALHGILAKIRDLNLPLLSVRRQGPSP